MLSDAKIKQLRRLVDTRRALDEAKAALKAAQEAFDDAEHEVYEDLENGPMTRLPNVDLGPGYGKVSFQSRTTTYGKVLDPDEFKAWLRKTGQYDTFVEGKIGGARINEMAKHYVEAAEQFPPGLTYRFDRGVTISQEKSYSPDLLDSADES